MSQASGLLSKLKRLKSTAEKSDGNVGGNEDEETSAASSIKTKESSSLAKPKPTKSFKIVEKSKATVNQDDKTILEGEEGDTDLEPVSDEDNAQADNLSEADIEGFGDTDVSIEQETDPYASDKEKKDETGRELALAGLLGDNNGATNVMYSKMDMNKFLLPGNVADAPIVLSTKDFASEEDRLREFENIYGKLKKREVRKNESELAEHGDPPTPKNLYEALQSNFLKTMARSHLYRMVMAGTHKEDQEGLIDWIRDLIDDINVHCYSEIITGVLTIYPNHFIHVIEGSEDTLIKYMKLTADQFEPTGLDWKLEFRPGKGVKVRDPITFTTVKTFVIGMFRIKHRGILSGWKAERAYEVSLSESDVPPGGYREKLFQFAKACSTMGVALYKLTPLRYSPPKDPSTRDMNEAKEKFEEAKRRRAHSMSKIVPKTSFIDYILKKDEKRKIQLRTLREHIDFFWHIPHVILSQQTDWPIPCRIAPYD